MSRISFLFLIFILLFSIKGYSGGTQKLLITEFMVYNDSVIADEDGDYTDWVEIYNPGSVAINLLNWSLTDDPNNIKKWYFPDIQIQPGQYMLVFSSGKDRRTPGSNLHTNFKLSGKDSFLGLLEPDSITLSSFYSSIPEQFTNISYGYYSSSNTYFDVATPGIANVASNFISPPYFSVERGFFTQSFTVMLLSNISGATIRYTTNGSYPSTTAGTVYSSPITITKTTPLRAVVYYNGKVSAARSNTYIFLADVKTQSNSPAGYPAKWGPYTTSPSTFATADYEMDPDIVNSTLYKDSLDKAFKSIPTMSVITDISNLFSSTKDSLTGGIYYYTGAPKNETEVPAPVGTTKVTIWDPGHGWGRLASVEYFNSDRSENFFVNCRLELHGGHSRRAEKCPKHSFNLEFKSDYGVPKLKYDIYDNKSAVNEFDALVLRGGFGDSWVHSQSWQRNVCMYIHDAWLKNTQMDMGEKGSHSKFVHLYLNGLYWGLYCISERIDEDFAASYFKGNDEEFDIIKDYGEATSGTTQVWDTMMVRANRGVANNEDYFKLLGKNADGSDNINYPTYVSVDNFIDFMLANIYGGNSDWDTHNWSAARNFINPGNGFKFFVWDGEMIFRYLNDDAITSKYNLNRPTGLFKDLMANNEFKLEVADHIQRHFFNNGALTPTKVVERYMKLANEVNLAVICESARWGDYRQSTPCSKANYWDVELERLLNDYFPYRTDTVFKQLKALGLYPSVTAPSLSWYGKKFVEDTTITITAPSGTIYYTTDGSDPRLVGGGVAATAQIYNGTPVVITDTVTIKARVKSGSEWSAMAKADYIMIPSNLSRIENLLFSKTINDIWVYPNPVTEWAFITFTLPKSGIVNIQLFTPDGKMVSQIYSGHRPEGTNTIPWQKGSLKQGIYIYRISFFGFIKSGKLVVE